MGKKKVAKLPGLEKTLIPAEFNDILELDELWSFIGKKSNKSWTWIALCRRTRQIVGFSVGDRSVKTCCKLKASIPENYTNLKTYSDFWDAYKTVFTEDHQSIGKETGQTNHIERWNNTLRQRVGRFVRKTLSFSKIEENHIDALKLFIHDYNCKIKENYLVNSISQ